MPLPAVRTIPHSVLVVMPSKTLIKVVFPPCTFLKKKNKNHLSLHNLFLEEYNTHERKYDEHHAEHGVENQHDRRRGVRVQRHSHAGEIVRLLLIYISSSSSHIVCENEFEFANTFFVQFSLTIEFCFVVPGLVMMSTH